MDYNKQLQFIACLTLHKLACSNYDGKIFFIYHGCIFNGLL